MEADHAWRVSSRSSGSGNCVQVARQQDDSRLVRDSKDPTGPWLLVVPTQWAAFTQGVHDGEFD